MSYDSSANGRLRNLGGDTHDSSIQGHWLQDSQQLHNWRIRENLIRRIQQRAVMNGEQLRV